MRQFKLKPGLQLSFDRPVDFIHLHQVFRMEDLEAAYGRMGRDAGSAREAVRYHVKTGRIHCVRRGVYTRSSAWDPWLIAGKLTSDAIVSHDGALSFFKHTGLGHRLTFSTAQRTSVARYNEVIYEPHRIEPHFLFQEVQEHERYGQPLRVTSLERTLVDCLNLLSRSPPVLELLALFKRVAPTMRVGKMIAWAERQNNRMLMSRLGLFLAASRPDLTQQQFALLEREGVRTPTYFQRGARTSRDELAWPWNLILSPELMSATTPLR